MVERTVATLRVSRGKKGSYIDGAVPHHSIELALDISLAPTRLQGPCILGHPARRHSRMRVQLMASARHAIERRDASPLFNAHATGIQSHDLEANPL